MELGPSSAMLVVLLGLTTAAVLSVVSGLEAGSASKTVGIVIAWSCSVADCALKAAAMAMAPLMPVPATRQMTVL